MPSKKPFLPPRLNPVIMACAKAALPLMFHLYAGGIEVSISEEDLARLRALKRQRLLLLPNHPTHFDPMVLIDISRRIDEDFLFVAAREVFDWNAGLRGWLFQRCGVYSLIRGAVDRDSFAMTQQILSQGQHPLVIFIEGEVSLDNASILPFEPGVISLAMRVQDKLSGTPENPPLHLAPIAMRTIYKPGLESAINTALIELEQAVGIDSQGATDLADKRGSLPAGHLAQLGLNVARGSPARSVPPPPSPPGLHNLGADPCPPAQPWPSFRTRINAVGNALLTSVESTYLLQSKPTDSLDARMTRLKDRLLNKIESFLDLTPDPAASVLDRIRTVKNRMDRIIHTYTEDPVKVSPYESRLLDRRRQTFAEFYADLARLINMLTLHAGYLDHAPPERFAEVLIRLQQEILGKPRLTHPRTVHVRLGQVQDLRPHLPSFRTDKRRFCTTFAESLEQEMLALLKGVPCLPGEGPR